MAGTLAAAFEGEASVEALAAGASAGATCGGAVMGVKQPGNLTPMEEEAPCLSLGFREGPKEVDTATEYNQLLT